MCIFFGALVPNLYALWDLNTLPLLCDSSPSYREGCYFKDRWERQEWAKVWFILNYIVNTVFNDNIAIDFLILCSLIHATRDLYCYTCFLFVSGHCIILICTTTQICQEVLNFLPHLSHLSGTFQSYLITLIHTGHQVAHTTGLQMAAKQWKSTAASYASALTLPSLLLLWWVIFMHFLRTPRIFFMFTKQILLFKPVTRE